MIYQKEKIAARIRAERKQLGVTLDQFAKELHYSKPTLVEWERKNGKNRIPSMEQLLTLCEHFNCEVAYLLGEIDTKTRVNADIQNETGLTEEAINVLRKHKKAIDEKDLNYKKKNLLSFGNAIKADLNTTIDIFNATLVTDADLIDSDFMIPSFISFALTYCEPGSETTILDVFAKQKCRENVLFYNYCLMPKEIREICTQAYITAKDETRLTTTDYSTAIKERYDQLVKDMCNARKAELTKVLQFDLSTITDPEEENALRSYNDIVTDDYEGFVIQDCQEKYYIIRSVIDEDIRKERNFLDTQYLYALSTAFSNEGRDK